MTSQLLTAELSTLIQESKRKNIELRNAADQSLTDLKSFPRTSDAQIAADLKCRPTFVRPFLLACGTRNPKFAGSAVICLQRLIVTSALPSETLTGVLEAFRECSTLALDIQLKVLQALPSLLQNYASSLTGRLLEAAFQVCFLLYSAKTAVVSNTAAAALQQLVNSTFEKASSDSGGTIHDVSAVEVPIGDGALMIRGAALDSYHLLEDVCLLTDGQKPKTLRGATLSQNFGLELLESILKDHADTVMAHPEQIHILRIRLMPLVIKTLSERALFPATVRIMRLLQQIIGRLLFALASECEMALSLLNHMLDADAAPLWKRALCLEVFRGIYAEPALVRRLYAHFDEVDEKRNIIRDQLGGLVRLASEKPAIIGLGRQSSIAISTQGDDSGEQAAVQAGGLIGSIGVTVTMSDTNNQGISALWSTIRVQCLEQLDKSEAPNLPATYIYSVALDCITAFSEGLARFLLPFTVQNEPKSKRSKTIPVNEDGSSRETLSRNQSFQGRRAPINPLSLTKHVLYSQISTSAHMVDQCWPALLAASSTYFNATLDSGNYHVLVRSFQKFTQIAGLLGLATPRDAFLTTLGKHSVPLVNNRIFTNPFAQATNGRGGATLTGHIPDSDRDSNPSPSVSAGKDRRSFDMPIMNTRHLLCLRALLNLGIVLGPVLQRSWTIILETLQQADLILTLSQPSSQNQTTRIARNADIRDIADDANEVEDLSLEITAAKTAASRLFESTGELPNRAFLDHLKCLCALLQDDTAPELSEEAADTSLSGKRLTKKHHKLRSVSGTPAEGAAASREGIFILDKLDNVIQSNVARFSQNDGTESGWDLLLQILMNALQSQESPMSIRIHAANVLHNLLGNVALSMEPVPAGKYEALKVRSLDALLNEISAIRVTNSSHDTKPINQCNIEIHQLALEVLRSILERCGDSLKSGWNIIFSIILSVFDKHLVPGNSITHTKSISPKLVRTSFGSLQLVCSDFLGSVPSSCFLILLDTLQAFCAQTQDLNISLAAATFFRNISDFLYRDTPSIPFEAIDSTYQSQESLISLAEAQDFNKSIGALWLCLLLRLVTLTTDDRLEVRHSALHTLFRIFEACSDQLTAIASHACLNVVLLRMLAGNQEEYHRANESPNSHDNIDTVKGWCESTIIITVGTSKLFTQWLERFNDSDLQQEMWKALLEFFDKCLERRMLKVSAAVFEGMSNMLGEIEDSSFFGEKSVDMAWTLWQNSNPASHVDVSIGQKGNQDALVAYLHCLCQLLRLIDKRLMAEQAQMTMVQLRSCVADSDTIAYNADIDHMTSVQKLVLESLRMIPGKAAGIVPEVIECINGLVTLAYDQEDTESPTKQTYLGLSKSSMDLLESCIEHHVKNPGINAIDIATTALNALSVPIHLKYNWRLEGKGVPPWRKATAAAVAILQFSMPVIWENKDSDQKQVSFWNTIVGIVDGIVAADCAACTKLGEISEDQDFDMDHFKRVKDMMIPKLGGSPIPDSVRRKYSESIMQSSIIHEPHPDDLARQGQELLDGLRSNHIGRVQDIPTSPRSKLGYVLLDHLFGLVALHDGSPERIRLAQAAAPYLILRIGLTLKAYTFDQPLRGRMPQPWSQKKEMLYILRKVIELKSEPKAIPAAPGVTSQHKKHLHRLYSLVIKASRAAWRDEEMTQALREVLEAVGEDFGI